MKAVTIAACAALTVLLGAPAPAVPPQEEYESAFIALRDSIGLQAYSGCLKGPEGVRRDGAGNSLDRAMLLARMLRERGHTVRIAHGRLRGQALAQVVALARAWGRGQGRGLAPELQPAAGSAEAQQELERVLRDHYWVQVGVGENWFSLDPTLPDALPGETIASLRNFYETLPAFLYQRLELELFCEFYISGQYARAKLLSFNGLVKDLAGRPLTLLFVRREAGGRFRYSPDDRFAPVLISGGRLHQALNLRTEAARIAARGGGPMPAVDVGRVWMVLTLRAPGSADRVTQRLLYSNLPPAFSRLHEVMAIAVSSGAGGHPSSMAWSLRTAADGLAGVGRPAARRTPARAEVRDAAALLGAQRALCRAAALQLLSYIDDAARWIDSGFATDASAPQPQVLALAADPLDGSLRADVLLLDTRPLAEAWADELAAPAAGFALGVTASLQEGRLLASLLGHSGGTRDAVEATARALRGGGRWRAVDRATIADLEDFDLPAEASRLMEAAAEAGRVLILPESSRSLGPGGLVWWELDGETGMMIGMLHPGFGGAQGELPPEWGDIAAAYAPGVGEDWPGRLAELCRSAAETISRGAGAWRGEACELVPEAVLLVHALASDALQRSPRVTISPRVRRLLGGEGEALLRRALAALCPASIRRRE